MPTRKLFDGKHRMGYCPIHGHVPVPHPGCKFSPAEPWAMDRQVPDSALYGGMMRWLESLDADGKRVAREHFERNAADFEQTERGREFLRVLRANT